MPLYETQCLNGHTRTVYYAQAQDKRCRTHICPECGHSETFVLSMGRGLTYFSSKTPQVIYNLGPEPVTITSPAQHERLMKERKLAWMPQKRGMPGAWF